MIDEGELLECLDALQEKICKLGDSIDSLWYAIKGQKKMKEVLK